MPFQTIGSPALWAAFLAFVALMLVIDLGVFHRRAHPVSLREAAIWSAVWVTLSGLFALFVWAKFGGERALEFTTGYVLEKALSVDNLFVFVVLFTFFGIPAAYQHRVLFWGILGALVTRGAFILAGGALVQSFHWVLYVFGGILVVTGLKLFGHSEETVAPERNIVLRLFRRLFPVAPTLDGPHFWVTRGGRRLASPLLVTLVTVEATDVVFAVDSIPAVFAVTDDPFIVFTSNIFAILGLRALYFLLAGVMGMFRYLKVGLAVILVFVGAKMLLSRVLAIPVGLSLGVIAVILAISIAISWLRREPDAVKTPGP